MEKPGVLIEVFPERHGFSGYLAQHAFDGAGCMGHRAACIGLWACRKCAKRRLDVRGCRWLIAFRECSDGGPYGTFECLVSPHHNHPVVVEPPADVLFNQGFVYRCNKWVRCDRPEITGLFPQKLKKAFDDLVDTKPFTIVDVSFYSRSRVGDFRQATSAGLRRSLFATREIRCRRGRVGD